MAMIPPLPPPGAGVPQTTFFPPREVGFASIINNATLWLERNEGILHQVQQGRQLFDFHQLTICLNMHGTFSEHPSPLTGGLLVTRERHTWMRAQFGDIAPPEQMAKAQRELADDLLTVLEAIEVRAETTAIRGPRASFFMAPVVGDPEPPPQRLDARRFKDSAAYLVARRPDATPPTPKRPLISEPSLCRIITDKTTAHTRASLTTRDRETYDFLKCLLYEDGSLRERANVEGLVEATPRYQVRGVLGRGGMGLVLLADEPALGREVVIKLMFTQQNEALDEGVWDLFDNEMVQQGGLIGMEGLLPAFGRSETIDGHPFLITQRCKGNLEDLLNSHTPSSLNTLKLKLLTSWREAVRYLERVVASIAKMHEKDLVHSDIKPGNVLVGLGDEPLTSDFGLAQPVDSATGKGKYQDGIIRGTPGYMAPEAASGSFYSKQNDVFALGCLIYELLTGIQPVDDVSRQRGGPDIAPPLARLLAADWVTAVRPLAVVRGERLPIFLPSVFAADIETDIPEKLEAVVKGCLAVDPAERYQDANELLAALREVLARMEAEPFWNEAMTELRIAEEARSTDMTAWTTHARTAFYKAVEAIRRYPEPQWLAQTMQVLFATLEYAEGIGDEMLIGQIQQDMGLIKSMIPQGQEPHFQPVLATSVKATTPGLLNLTVTSPRESTPLVTLFPLREIGGVVRVPEGAPHIDLSDHLRPQSDTSFTLAGRVPRGNYLVRVEAEGCAPMQEVFFLRREGEAEIHLQLVEERLIPRGLVPIAGGRIDRRVVERAYNIPPTSEDTLTYVNPFLVAKTPVTQRQYLLALFRTALQSGMDQALERQLKYGPDRPMWPNLQTALTQMLSYYEKHGRNHDMTLETLIDAFLAKERKGGESRTLSDSDGDVLTWEGSATWIHRDNIPWLIETLQPGGRLPTPEEYIRLVTGGDRRKWPWGDSDPELGDGQFHLGDDVPLVQAVGTTSIQGRRGYLDRSPLSPEVVDVAGIRIWVQGEQRGYGMTMGIGWSYRPPSIPLLHGLGPRSGLAPGVSVRIAMDFPGQG
ncbi:MAG: serine/threonine protein kinase [candidate division NC10 bacterium]|nr:serine/threonine protein kinase [candidate division NC10 bacterium]